MSIRIIEIRITDEKSENADRLTESALALRSELLGMAEVKSVEQATSATPKGAKSGLAITAATLLIGLRYSAPALKEMRGFFNDWLRRNDGKRITYKVDGNSVDFLGLPEKSVEKILNSDAGPDVTDQ